MILPAASDLQRLFRLLETSDVDYRPLWRWLLLPPDWQPLFTLDAVRRPSVAELVHCLRWLEAHGAEHWTTATWLLAAFPQMEQVTLELRLDVLLQQPPDGWTHPTQVFAKPQPDYRQLLQACQVRRAKTGEAPSGPHPERLQSVEHKLTRAVLIGERVRHRLAMRRLKGDSSLLQA